MPGPDPGGSGVDPSLLVPVEDKAGSGGPAFVVGIGASAGGLEALERFFGAMPADSGMAFVVIQHLSPDFKSLMDELLARRTRMSVQRVTEPVEMRPNTVYLLPPRKEMLMEQGRLLVVDKPTDHTLSMPINTFFRALAREQGEKAVAIVLSGTGSDGSKGLLDVHDAGGLVLVQNEESAKFDGMPRSAVATGLAAAVIAPEEMPSLLVRHATHVLNHDPSGGVLTQEPGQATGMPAIIDRLREVYNIDFNFYKPGTITRRIERRAAILHAPDANRYAERVLADPVELETLYKDLLIGVTRFFRDPEAFALLREKVIPCVLDAAVPEEDIRVWVPGCATGEEAYSLGILFLEEFARRGRIPGLKIFATDMHRESLRCAADGVYPVDSLEALAPDQIEEFFIREPDGRRRVQARLRKLVLFSPHNVLRDTPFARIDLVSCRNLLIYFRPPAQTRALSAFHFALKLKGFLFLGPSESTGELEPQFEAVDRRWKIYTKLTDVRLPMSLRVQAARTVEASEPPQGHSGHRLARAYDTLLSRFVPTGVLVNEQREAVHLFGAAGRFLRPPAGRVSSDVVAMCQGDLRIAVSSAFHHVLKKGDRVVFKSVRVPFEQAEAVFDISAEPLPDRISGATFVLILFSEERPRLSLPSSPAHELALRDEERERMVQLESELQQSRESLQTAVEELESTNEELQASNEELLSSNEELQSTNEELHSVNEELYTVNAENQEKIRELNATTTDLRNLMGATEVGIVFTDADQRVRLFTPGATAIFNLLPQDTGRDLRHITSQVPDDDVFADIARVRETHVGCERQVRTHDGRSFLRQIKPYLDSSREPMGFVLTFVEVTALVRAGHALQASEEQFRLITEGTPSAVVMVNDHGIIEHANPQTRAVLGYEPAELTGRPMDLLMPERLRQRHATHVAHFHQQPQARPMGEFRALLALRKDGTEVPVEIGLSPIRLRGRIFTLAFITDISVRRRAEAEVKESEERFRRMANDAPVMIWLADAAGRRTFFNETWLRFTGRTLEQELGDGWNEGLHPDGREPFLKAYLEACARAQPFELEYRLRRSDGSYAWIVTRASPRLGHGQEFLGLIGCCTDISGQKLMAEEQRRIEEKLQETAKLESLGILAGGIAHDFNNILTGILGNISLAQLDLPAGSPLRETLAAVQEASVRASELCKQMLAYSGRGRFVLKHVELGWLVKDTTNLVHAAVTKNVTLEVDLAPSLPLVEVDVPQIQQVLMNLVINASEAIGDRPGVVRLRTGRCSDSRDGLGLEVVSPIRPLVDYVFLEVSDNGSGISQESLKRIFDPFFTTKFTGRGLGLAAVQGIVRGHHGGLFVWSEEGRGTVFRLLLPCRDGLSDTSWQRRRTPELFRGHGEVLVVDDEEVVRTTIARILERLGYRCGLAKDGLEAIRQFREGAERFRMVILDLTMPGMDGARTFAELRKVDPSVKVLLISGFNENEATARFAGSAPAGFLQKPIVAEDLLVTVQSILDGVPLPAGSGRSVDN